MLLGILLQQGDDLEAGRGVKSAGRLIEKEDFGCSDQLAGDAQTSLLTARDALADRGTDKDIGLLLETEAIDQDLYSGSRSLGDRSMSS